MRIGFDHTYVITNSSRAFDGLAHEGFTLDPKTVEHPGDLICRFIMFPITDNFGSTRKTQYLEFCEDTKIANSTGSVGTDADPYTPGFSLRVDKGLEAFYELVKEGFSGHGINLKHKNYDWKIDSVSRLPGWNFVVFDKPLIPGIMIWLTEYEPLPDREPEPTCMEHENRCEKFIGFVWTCDQDALAPLARLTSRPIRDGKLVFDDGIYISCRPELKESVPSFKKKRSPFAAVLMKCSSLETFKEHSKNAREIEWDGKPALLLEQSDTSWDIIVL